MNDFIHRTLTSAKVPSRLKPSGLHHSDGKCPDEITMIPWVNGKLLVWGIGAISPDIFVPLYISRALAEDRKRTKYSCLEPSYTFTTIAIEILGNFSKFLKDLGNRLRQAAGDKNFYIYLPYPETLC